MAENKCQHCGNNVPAGSKFCNHCGASIGTPPPPKPEENPGNGQHRVRNTFIIIAILAFVGLIIVRNCFFSGNIKSAPVTADSIYSESTYTDIFNRVLESNNMKIDGDCIAYAIPVDKEENDSVRKIIGVTYLNDDKHAFYKIYTLTSHGGDWNIKQNEIKYLSGQYLEFAPAELRCEEIPAIDNIGGKRYFYFAYLSMPRTSASEGNTATISTVLFDIESGTIARQIDFTGTPITGDDGQNFIMATSYTAGAGFLDARLVEHAKNIGYLHFPTAEELEAERAEQERLLQEKARQDSLAAVEAAATTQAFDEGKEITTQVQEQDKNKPLFRAEDFSKKIQGGGYTVFLLKNGKVYAFNKAAATTFEVPFGGSATNIGWEDSGAGVLNIRTASGKIQYNLTNHTMKKVE